MRNQEESGKETMLTVIFAVFIFAGVHFLRMPWPFSQGKEFIHLGYVFTALALVNVDIVKAWLAALFAFVFSSILDGNFSAIPGQFVYLTISSLATASVYGFWMDRDELTSREERKITAKTVLMYGALIVLSNRAWTSWSLMHGGEKVADAAMQSLRSSGPVLVTAGMTIILTVLLIMPVSVLCRKIQKK